jgi:cation diffusion facilitator family transporter
MAGESALRLFAPLTIHFNEAITVAAVGLVVNLVSAWLLRDKHAHSHEGPWHSHGDHNLRAAYLHVLADALTSVTAILALVAGKFLGWIWMDPVMGIVGAAVVARWSYGLLRDTSTVLLDAAVDPKLETQIRAAIENDSDARVTDLHVWRIGGHRLAAVVSIVTSFPKTPDHYKSLLSRFNDLVHVTIEVNADHLERLTQ